jgi:hypothetical protein
MPYITCQHHPAAADGRHSTSGGSQERGPGGPDQDHSVHPLPDFGAGSFELDCLCHRCCQ